MYKIKGYFFDFIFLYFLVVIWKIMIDNYFKMLNLVFIIYYVCKDKKLMVS